MPNYASHINGKKVISAGWEAICLLSKQCHALRHIFCCYMCFPYARVLTRNFKTCLQDSLLGANWRPRMKNMRTGIRI